MGCGPSKDKAPPQTLAEKVKDKVRIEHYGVLGMRREGRHEVKGSELPDGDTVIIDPCNADFVHRSGPQHAGGAAGAIYQFLNIKSDPSFAQQVKAEIKGEGSCAYHRYGYPTSKHVIHAVGYDFRRPGPWGSGSDVDEDAVVDLLGGLYAKILALASKYGRKKLRLVPISAGIFSGSLQSRMPELTAQALLGAINMTFGADAAEDPHRSTYVDMIEYIEMCIYMESDYRAYARAWERTKNGYTEASENAVTPRGADAPVAPAAARVQSTRELDAPAMAAPQPVRNSTEPAMGTASFDAGGSPAASPGGGAAPGSPPQMPPVSPPQMPPVQDYGY